MKILYIFPNKDTETAGSGEIKKAKMQRKLFEENGIDCEIQMLRFATKKNRIYEKILRRFPLYHVYSTEACEEICNKIDVSVQAIYIRKEKILDISIIGMLKKISERNSPPKVILEIPTYPYDKEFSRFVDFPILLRDRYLRKKFKHYVNRIVVCANETNVFGVPCIQIDNGIDCAAIHVRKVEIAKTDVVRLVGVASVGFWHGYDRVIRGLGEYYKSKPNKKVEFHIVGDGTVVKELKKLCCELKVEQYVFFHGWMHGKELDDMFDQCDIGVGSLGMYRIGLENGNTLKLREYVARGIPFFYGYTDKLIESCVHDYTMRVPNNDSPVDIPTIISFYEKMQAKGFDKIAIEMRKLAEEHLSWAKQMKPVVDYILSDEK